MTFVQARWYTPAHGRRIDWLVVHCMEAPESGSTAESVARYFASTDRKASAHACVDDNSRVDCVKDHDVAYGASHANRNGLHLEQAGYARQTRAEWLDPYGRKMIGEQAAGWLAEKSVLHDIPLVFLGAVDLKAGKRGVTTHHEVEQAWPSTGHHDPGPGYPMDVLLSAAGRLRAARSDPAPPAHLEEDVDVKIHHQTVTIPKDGVARVPVSIAVPFGNAASATVKANDDGTWAAAGAELYAGPDGHACLTVHGDPGQVGVIVGYLA